MLLCGALDSGSFIYGRFCLIYVAIFFAIVAVVDFSLGRTFHFLQARAGGITGAEYYVCEKVTEDIIIMGSSRASHHYVPEIISEELGMSCFNAGRDGNGIILQYGRCCMKDMPQGY